MKRREVDVVAERLMVTNSGDYKQLVTVNATVGYGSLEGH